ncbi:MAG: ribokinase [Pseudomonadota bacterium]
MSGRVAVLGAFVADCTFRAARPPEMGETVLGKSFALGPGGKGSNQAVAAAKAGAEASMLTRLGADPFAELARQVWAAAGVTPAIIVDPESYTGAAYIYVEDQTGNNAIIVAPGAAGAIAPRDVAGWDPEIGQSDVFLTQLETPLPAGLAGLSAAKAAGVTTILNPAPAAAMEDAMLEASDFVTPNESEAEGLTGVKVASVGDAERAADALIARGAGAAIVTLGENGAFLAAGAQRRHIPAMEAGPVVETTGAGDAFNGGFAAALARGADPMDAALFGSATAALSVTKAGAAASMPDRADIETLLSSTG